MADGTCSVEGCTPTGRLRGKWCNAHYLSWKRHGDPLAARAPRPVVICSVQDCSTKRYGNGLCQKHYNRMRIRGTTDDPPRLTAEEKSERRRAQQARRAERAAASGATCQVEECPKTPRDTAGLCAAHYRRKRLYGDPRAFAPQRPLGADPFRLDSPAICTIDGCHEAVCYSGLCQTHYDAFRKHGDPLKVRPPRRRTTPLPHSASTEERFWVKVDRNGPLPASRPDLGPCWLWLGGLTQDGYGVFQVTRERRRQLAHRFAWQNAGRELVPGLTLDHLCDVRACVRPGHCRQVSQQVNAARSSGVCAANARKTRCMRGHPFTPENTNRPSRGGRQCRTCYNEFRRRRRATVRLGREDRAISRAYRAAIADDPCRYCGGRAGNVDHYFPVAKGGSDMWTNLGPACAGCNRSKRATCGTAFALRGTADRITRVFPRAVAA
jgi:hypothetical protein